MRNQKLLLLHQIDRKLAPFKAIDHATVPPKGWIHHIRTALNMTLEQLGNRMKMSKQGIKKIEEREHTGSISIKSLKEVGRALDMHLVYGYIPNHGTLENLVNSRAEKLARKIVMRTNQTMQLENQGNSNAYIEQAIEEMAIEIKREMRKSLWD